MEEFSIKSVFPLSDEFTSRLEVEWLKRSFRPLLSMLGDKLVFKLNDDKTDEVKTDGEEAGDVFSSLHFEAQLNTLNGKFYLDIESGDISYLINRLDSDANGEISIEELEGVTLCSVLDRPLIENHTRDADVTKYMLAEGVVFQYTPEPVINGKPGPGVLEFDADIVSVGFDDDWNVISFICPQEDFEIDNIYVSGTVTGEVELGEVGGRIDPVTGLGTIYIDDLAWKFWGDVEIYGEQVSISKDEAAFIPIDYAPGSGGVLALENIDIADYGDSNINELFSSYLLEGTQGNPTGIQIGPIQETVIQGVNLHVPGFANPSTDLEWYVNFQDPIAVVGDEYIDIAHGAEMHGH